MRVFYINCFADPWVKVAKKLKETYGYEPVYWVGYQEDDSKELVAENFKSTIFQEDIDAWKGLFPEQIATKANESYINIDFLREYALYEEQALKMLDRLDVDRYRFNLMERQRHIRNLLRNWTAAIEYLKPDLVVTPAIPHRGYDYVLWMLCKFCNIPFFIFNHTRFSGRFMLITDFFTIGDSYIEDYKDALGKQHNQIDLPNDIKSCFEQNKLDYSVARPAFMTSEEKTHLKWNSSFWVFLHVIARLYRRRKNLFGERGVLKLYTNMYYKEGKNISVEQSRYPINLFLKDTIANVRYKKKLYKYYESKTEKPDYDEPYVVFFLHYQPEATTSPSADIFVDQRLCIDVLLKYLPSEYKVYVKEHPHQFFAHREGHTSRMRFFYDDMLKNSRVKLISTKESSFDLIANCKAIGTICGTVGWESIVRGKPVILFGISWYENYDKGVLRIKDEDSASRIKEFIDNYKYDEYSLLAYLEAVGKNTKLAYYYKAYYKDQLGISEEECINNIVDSIVQKYNDIEEENVQH